MQILIRKESKTDYNEVFNLIEKAFENEPQSDHREQFLVARLRGSKAFIPELSLVAVYNQKIVGHILLTKIKIENNVAIFDSLALAPVSIIPVYQNKGIGSDLIIKAHSIAKELGFTSIVLIGHENYYPKFGYELCSKYNITLPFQAPDNNCMVISLSKNALKNLSGKVKYAKEFYE